MEHLKSLLNADLLRHALLLEAMTTILRSYLPAEAAAHCWVGGVRERVLIVVADSASFAVAAHYQQHKILKRINSNFKAELSASLNRLKTKIAKLPAPARIPLQRPTLSANNADILASSAMTVADPELRAALDRLARRGKGKHL
jgi:hypothetical protein